MSLGLLVFFADHLAHSIQVGRIMRQVERNTLPVIRELPATGQLPPRRPDWAVAIPARVSGYVQVVHAQRLLSVALDAAVTVKIRPRPGEHVVAGTTLGWVWARSPVQPPPDADRFSSILHTAV